MPLQCTATGRDHELIIITENAMFMLFSGVIVSVLSMS